MVYLDYSATTKPSQEVLDDMQKYMFNTSQDFNSITLDIKKTLNTSLDVIYTSGATESNNLAIYGICNKYKKGHIISTKLEHASVTSCLLDLESKGFIIDYVSLNKGVVDLKSLEDLICEETILVTIGAVNSEIGLLQPIDEIGKILKKKKIVFHSDMTQALGKVPCSFNNVSLVTFAPHKFYGLKGVGVLLKNKDIDLEPIIFGDRLYNYGLIHSASLAISLAYFSLEEKYKFVSSLKDKLLSILRKYPITINSNRNCIPHIVNISVSFKPETFLHMLEEKDIYISTNSACSSSKVSSSLLAFLNDPLIASHGVRISLSANTTVDELDKLDKALEDIYER